MKDTYLESFCTGGLISPKPVIAVTMGDPCGIGPEVIVKGWMDTDCRPFVVGNAYWMRCAAAMFAPSVSIHPITKLSQARFETGVIDVFDTSGERLPCTYGTVHPAAARAALQAITQAAQMALGNTTGAIGTDVKVDAITTAPIHKGQMQAVGFAFPGHTEFFANAAHTDRFRMMMVGGGLRVTLTTIHLSLREAVRQTTREEILTSICLTHEALERDFGILKPHIAVAALNPHAGEEGQFGKEEQQEITPAVLDAQKKGVHVSGPIPADTLFYYLRRGRYDAAVALYHDQALIPIKLVAFENAVNVTLGLSIIRTSVDHGTAYDIAGKGVADSGSFRAALALAAAMARKRRKMETVADATG